MSIDPTTLTETITVKHVTSITKSGDPVWGSPVTMPARIERAKRTQVGADGSQLDDVTMVFTTLPLVNGDIVWFPEDDTSTNEPAHRCVNCSPLRDLYGDVHHYESTF